MSVRPLLTSSLLIALAAPASAFAHAKVTSPPARFDRANIKEGEAPCGGARGNAATMLTGGQMLTLEYDETVGHPGFFQLRFSMAGDANWQMLADNIPDQGGVGSYSYEFQVPDVTCTDCTFQWVQVMTDRNPPTNYYSCFDVEIAGAGGNNSTPDMGTAPPDAGSGTPDVGGTTPDLGSANNNTGGNNGSVDDGSGGGNPVIEHDAGMESGSDANINATGTCSSVRPAGRLSDAALAWMLLGFAAISRRVARRSSRGSSEAPQ